MAIWRIILEMGLIDDARWMETIGDRNLTSHNYDDETAEEVYMTIVEAYYPLFKKFEQIMLSLRGNSPKNYGIRK